MRRPRVLLADDHPLVIEALKSVLAPEFDLAGVVDDGIELVNSATRLDYDVIVADISMPRLDGLQALAQMRRQDPRVKVVFITMHQEPVLARRALDAGALGFVMKYAAADELIPALRAALAGETYVSPTIGLTRAREAQR